MMRGGKQIEKLIYPANFYKNKTKSIIATCKALIEEYNNIVPDEIDELLKLKKETGCHLTVDFAHLKARNIGIIDYDVVMKKISKIGHIHAHFAGIKWGDKGERNHEVTGNKEIKELANEII